MNRVLGGVYSLDLASSLSTIISRRAHQGSFPGHLYILPPSMARTVKHCLCPCQIEFNDTEDCGCPSKLIRGPRKEAGKGEISP